MKVGRFEIIEEIARGGMGVVYRARDPNLDREVALKVLLGYGDAMDVARFVREAQATARLRHPNVVEVHETGEVDGRPYLAMRLVEGESLKAALKHGPMDLDRALEITRKLALAVDAAHQRGVLHRDIKPANVLLDSGGEPLLTDFGLAKLMGQDTQITLSGEVMGTPVYMPPEQANGRHDDIGPASDVYSLGALCYELLTGRPPFRGRTVIQILNAVLTRSPTPAPRLRPNLPTDVHAVLVKCLAKDPAQRYPGPAELVAALEACSLEPPRWRLPLVPVLGLGAALVIGGAVLLASRGEPPQDEPEPELSETRTSNEKIPPVPKGPSMKTLTLQPGQLKGKDTTVRSDFTRGNDNYGCDPHLIVGDRGPGGGELRSFVQFDLSRLPPAAKIESAFLSLWLLFSEFREHQDLSIQIQRVIPSGLRTPWIEGVSSVDQNALGMTWHGHFKHASPEYAINRPELGQPNADPDVAGVVKIRADQQLETEVRFDVTRLVSGWHHGGFPNHGLRLARVPHQHGHGAKVFASSDHSNSQFWPKLTIRYDGREADPETDEEPDAITKATELIVGAKNARSHRSRCHMALLAVQTAPFSGKILFLAALRVWNRGRVPKAEREHHAWLANTLLRRCDLVSSEYVTVEMYALRIATALNVSDEGAKRAARADFARLEEIAPGDPRIANLRERAEKAGLFRD